MVCVVFFARINVVLVRPPFICLLGLLLLSLGLIFPRIYVVLVRPFLVSLLRLLPLNLCVFAWVNVIVVTPSFILSDWLDGLFGLVTCPVKVVETELILLALLSLRLLLGLLTTSEVLLVVQLFLGLLLPTV